MSDSPRSLATGEAVLSDGDAASAPAGTASLNLWAFLGGLALLIAPTFKFDGPTGLRYLDTALSITRFGSPDVKNYPGTQDVVRFGDHVLVSAAPGPSLLATPVVWLGDRLFSIVGHPPPPEPARIYQLAIWLAFVMPMLLLLGWLCVRISIALGRPPVAARWIALGVLFATPVMSTSTGLRQNIYLIVSATYCLYLLICSRIAGRLTDRRAATLGLACSFAFFMDNQGVIIFAACLTAVAMRRSFRAIIWIALGFTPGVAGQLVYNGWSTGNPFTLATLQYAKAMRDVPPSVPVRLGQLTIDPVHGVLPWVPALFAVAVLVIRLQSWRTILVRCEVTFAVALTVGFFVLHGLVERRLDDYALGPRYALIWIVPVLLLAPYSNPAIRLLSWLGAAINVPGLLISQSAVNLAVWTPARALALSGPYVQWTSVLVEPAGSRDFGGNFPLAVPTLAGALVSLTIVIAAVLPAFFLLSRSTRPTSKSRRA